MDTPDSETPHPETTDFGFENVSWHEKAQRVSQVFDNVAPRYDLMNDLMSMGFHRLWKRFAISRAQVKPGHKVLDVAAGTGDLSAAFAKTVGAQGLVVLTDINAHMLTEGRKRLLDRGICENVAYVQGDASCLPFPENSFDRVTIAFGLRNVTNKMAALETMYRVLKPAGILTILEFSHPTVTALNPLYDAYSFHVIPRLGKLILNDEESYRYLVESIRMHPKQQQLADMMQTAGFEDVKYYNLSLGIVAVHQGYKF